MTSPPTKKLTLLALAWPIFVEQGLRILIGTVDTFMVAHVSDDAVAALGQASQVVFVSIVLFGFVGIGSSIVITHHLGANDRPGAARIGAAAIAVNTWIGLLVSLAVFAFAEPLLRFLQLPERLLPLAMQFLPLMGGTLFLEAQNVTMGAVLRSHGRARDPMWVTAAQNALNMVGNCVLLFGLLGMPRLGVTGVAISGVVSRLVALVALWALVHRRTDVRLKLRDYLSFPVREVRRILHIGLPAAGENLCWWTAFMVVTSFAARMGPTELAIRAYVSQISLWVILFGISVGLGSEILVGHRIGAGAFDEAYHELLRALRKGLLLVCGAISIIALCAPQIMGLLTRDPAIIAGGAVLLRMGLVLEPGRVFNLVVISSLRATGDTRVTLLISVLSMWGLWVPLSWLLGLKLGLGLPGLTIAMIVDEWLRGTMMYLRWKQRRWIEHAHRSKAQADAGVADLAAV